MGKKPTAAGQAILTGVDNQLRDNEPPETRETYDRLRSKGFSDKEARRLIGVALSCETFMILKHGDSYNHARYAANLHNLPNLPECAG